MSLSGKMVRQVEVKSHGDIFHDLWRHKPHQIADISPGNIQKVDHHEGDAGAVGSVNFWNYTVDGKQESVKVRIEAIDEEDKSVKFRAIEGDVLKDFTSFTSTFHVDTKGDNNLLTWTIEYEKKSENVEEPIALMNFALDICKDIETHHLN